MGSPDKPGHCDVNYGIKYSPPTAFNDELSKPSELLYKSENQRTLSPRHLRGQRVALGIPNESDLEMEKNKAGKKGFAEKFWDSPALQKGSDARMSRFNSMFYAPNSLYTMPKTYNRTPLDEGIQPAK